MADQPGEPARDRGFKARKREVAVGLVIPLLLDLIGLKLPGAVPAALVLVGGFVLRYVIVMANA